MGRWEDGKYGGDIISPAAERNADQSTRGFPVPHIALNSANGFNFCAMQGRLRTSVNVGSHLVLNSMCVAAGSFFAGRYTHHTGRWKIQAQAQLPGTSHGELCLRLLECAHTRVGGVHHTHAWFWYMLHHSCLRCAPFNFVFLPVPRPSYPIIFLQGLGSAGTLTTTLLALIVSIPPYDIPLATGREVLVVSLSAALTQTLLARELRRGIVYDGADEIFASTAYIHTLCTELQEKAAASWIRALHIMFQC
ncbi:MFS general substrate transporter [Mycena venus]|uniref:MFS general substrate transporter n=1 Tax=Mycena venus TaxID=2733690 RepID=A0A8H6YBB1_9AGAR|nr:MFS general substrate transporter [Mycena venus]